MEFVLVEYAGERDVLVDGVVAGVTNHMIALAPGTYTFSLDGVQDFTPLEHTVLVEGTSHLDPKSVSFA
jgi:hypothetical protein